MDSIIKKVEELKKIQKDRADLESEISILKEQEKKIAAEIVSDPQFDEEIFRMQCKHMVTLKTIYPESEYLRWNLVSKVTKFSSDEIKSVLKNIRLGHPIDTKFIEENPAFIGDIKLNPDVINGDPWAIKKAIDDFSKDTIFEVKLPGSILKGIDQSIKPIRYEITRKSSK